VFDVAIIVDGFALLIRRQIDREIDRLAAHFTGYLSAGEMQEKWPIRYFRFLRQ